MKQRAPRSLEIHGRLLATLVPLTDRFRYRSNCVNRKKPYVLSRFACLRREGQSLILESPLGHARVVLHHSAAAACVAELCTTGCRAKELAASVDGLSAEIALKFLEFLCNAGAISSVYAHGDAAENRDPALDSWEFHDLLFHSRSRVGRHGNPYGRVDRFHLPDEAKPVFKKRMSAHRIKLHSPDIASLCEQDVPFTRVLEERKSKRAQGKKMITSDQLGEFLFRSLRVRSVVNPDGSESTRRVYPCSGAAYELEVYLAIDRCRGVRAGLYHYDPLHHRLEHLAGKNSSVVRLLKTAAATAHTTVPQVLILVTARFQRLMLHYASIAYAAILKDVGVLYQTFYLVATAMGLSACALGAGDSDLFAETAKLNYYTESSVGEFLLNA